MKISPLHNKILVRIESAKERKVGNLIIPATTLSDKNHIVGLVIAVGKGKLKADGDRKPAPDVKPGDKVLLGKFAGTRFMIENHLCMVIFDKEIICVFEEDE